MTYRCLLLGGLLMAWMACMEASAQSTAISYQGNLQSDGFVVSGPFDFTFVLFNAGTNGAQVGVTVTNLNVQVTNGFFTTMMDFGTNTFLGSNRWVEVSVRTNGSTGSFATLSPRQLVTPAPFALYALRAGSGLVGPAGPAGTNGPTGTTGQNATTVYGTGSVTTSVTNEFLIPGLSQSVTVPSNSVTFISTDGNFRTESLSSAGFSEVEIYLKIDNALTPNGGLTDLFALNNTGTAALYYVPCHWALSQAVPLSPGLHTISVYAALESSYTALVSGDSSSPDQGELTVMFLKQ